MPRSDVEAGQQSANDPVRVCAECRRAKTIRGVWYLVPGRSPAPFVCETCFSTHGSLRAMS